MTQIACTRGSARVATVLSDWIDQLINAHQADIDKSGGVLGIHDWRCVKRYDSEARRVWVERIRRRPKSYLRKAIVIVSDDPLLKMAVAGANMVVAIAAHGEGRIEVATNIYEVLRKYKVGAPEP